MIIDYKKFMIQEIRKRNGVVKFCPYVRTWLGWCPIDEGARYPYFKHLFDGPSRCSSREAAAQEIKRYAEAHKVKFKRRNTYVTKMDLMP